MDQRVAKTIESFDNNAEFYYNYTVETVSQYHLTTFISYLKGKKILDAGCGSGRDVRYFEEEGFEPTGIDLSVELIKKASELCESPIKLMDMQSMEFPDEQFDGIWNCASFQHIPKENAGKVLGEFHRVLKKGGVLYISVKEGKGDGIHPSMKLNDAPVYAAFYLLVEVEELMRQNKFSIIKSFTEDVEGTMWVNIFARKL